jgi:hypothetical protein
MSEHPCPRDVAKVLAAKFIPIEKEIELREANDNLFKIKQRTVIVNKRLRELLRSIVADAAAMRCKVPNWYEVLDPPADHWFGPFEEGTVDHNDYTGFYIQWPNLGILLEQAEKMEMKAPTEDGPPQSIFPPHIGTADSTGHGQPT